MISSWLLCGVLLLTLLSPARTAAQVPRLALRVVASVSIPEEFPVAGVDAGSGSLFAIWSLHRPEVLLCCRPELQVIRSSEFARPVAVRVASPDSVIEVLDADRRTLLSVTRSGATVQRRAIPIAWEISRAVHSLGVWYIVGQDSTGATVLASLSASGEVLRQDELVPSLDSLTLAPAVLLARSPSGAFATLGRSPYTTWALSADHAPRPVPLHIPHLDPGSASPDSASIWVSLAPVPVDSFLVRTFSDLRSDRRLLVLYDERGAIIRETGLDAALGLIESQPGHQLLVGLRKLPGTELTFYHWRWETDLPRDGDMP